MSGEVCNNCQEWLDNCTCGPEEFMQTMGFSYSALNEIGSFPLAMKSYCEEHGLAFKDIPAEQRVEIRGAELPSELSKRFWEGVSSANTEK